MRHHRNASVLVAVLAALAILAAGCTAQTPRSDRPAPQATPAAPSQGAAERDGDDQPGEVSLGRTGPLTAPAALVQAIGRPAHSRRAIDATFGSGTFELWQPRHARSRFDFDASFQRRMPPCGKRGMWSHWTADKQIQDFHSRLTLRRDGSIVATQLTVYPTPTVAHRWMQQFTDVSFACSAVRTQSGDRPVKSQGLFAEELPSPYDRIAVDETVGQGRDYRLYNGTRGGSRAVAFRAGNAVLLAILWDPANGRPDLEVDSYAAIKDLSRPMVRELDRHYG